MLEFFYNVALWTPWTYFFVECALIQLGLLISLFFFNQARTLFYSAVYMFIIFIWLGIFLAYYNVELFTGFLWVVELTVIFIIILFLFFFNFSGELRTSNFFFFQFLAIFLLFFFFDESFAKSSLLNFNLFFDDFFEARTSPIMNDIHALFLSYYTFNGFLLVVFGVLVFLASIVCINILKASKAGLTEAVVDFLSIYNFFTELLNFEFLRKQSLFFQNLRKPTSRLVKKSSKEWFKKSQD